MSASSSDATVTVLIPYPPRTPVPTCRFLCEAHWTCHCTRRGHTWRQRSDCLLNTGEPYSVVIPHFREGMDLKIAPAPEWTGAAPQWRGIPCRVGRLELWLAVQGTAVPRTFSLFALLPRRDPADVLPYISLGVQFLVEHRARLRLDFSAGELRSSTGKLLIP